MWAMIDDPAGAIVKLDQLEPIWRDLHVGHGDPINASSRNKYEPSPPLAASSAPKPPLSLLDREGQAEHVGKGGSHDYDLVPARLKGIRTL